MVSGPSHPSHPQGGGYRVRRSRPVRGGDTVWLFDLDNTLHDASREIFKAIDRSMAQAVADTLNIGMDEANRLRSTYWKRYGATVIGLVRHHGIDMHTFLKASHQFDIASKVHAETGLTHKLRHMKGRKIVFTNAPLDYARTVLETLKILHHFEDVWAIDRMTMQGRLRPKPSVALMRQVVARLGVPAHRIVLVEDTLINLKSARRAGMRTAYIFNPRTPFSSGARGRDLFVDTRVNSIGKLLTAPGTRR
jgi:putative hydrolase of the HAD superfamily